MTQGVNMTHASEHATEHEISPSGSLHIVPPRVYFTVYLLLLFFMALTIAAAKVHMGGVINNIVAMTIAVIKATLVVLFFMQVKYSSRLTWVWAALGFIWLLFLFLTLGDYITRITPAGWQ